MVGFLTFIASLIIASVGFLFGRFYAESERILSEKRKCYTDFLTALPPLQDVYKDLSETEFLAKLEPAIESVPKVLFYADQTVILAWGRLHHEYLTANLALSSTSEALAPEYKALAKAQNDLVLEMRRDAFRWSIFNYNGTSRVLQKAD